MAPSVTFTHHLNTSRDGVFPTDLGSLFRCLINPQCSSFPKYPIQTSPGALEAVPSCSGCCLGKQTDPPTWHQPPSREKHKGIRSLPSLILARLNMPPSAVFPQTCAAALVLFSGQAPAPQCFSCHERPRAGHRM